MNASPAQNPPAKDWGDTHRFFLPNEDARAVAAAMALLPHAPVSPAFVGGSGMVLVQAAAGLPGKVSPVFVDLAEFQTRFFTFFAAALAKANTPDELRWWFAMEVFPSLRDHYRSKSQEYCLERVMPALRDLFGIELFYSQAVLDKAKDVAGRTTVHRADIGDYLCRAQRRHDFIYLSNVPDYLSPREAASLFAACREHPAAVYLLLTSACADPGAARAAWERAGYAEHPGAGAVNDLNRGLGSPSLARPWNRPGSIHLLMPPAASGPKPRRF
jgi:hypothetical protein